MSRLLPLLLLALLLGYLGMRKVGEMRSSPVAAIEEVAWPGLPPLFDPAFARLRPLEIARVPYATRFVEALGSETGALAYNAQPFRLNRHLGDDLNGIGGWNSDFGDPVHALATGLVTYSGIPSAGWGRSVALAHRLDPGDPTAVLQSFYAHLSKADAYPGELQPMGFQLGEVGTADGEYLAHLHLELREGLTADPGRGYHDQSLNRRSPSGLVDSLQSERGLQLVPAVVVESE